MKSIISPITALAVILTGALLGCNTELRDVRKVDQKPGSNVSQLSDDVILEGLQNYHDDRKFLNMFESITLNREPDSSLGKVLREKCGLEIHRVIEDKFSIGFGPQTDVKKRDTCPLEIHAHSEDVVDTTKAEPSGDKVTRLMNHSSRLKLTLKEKTNLNIWPFNAWRDVFLKVHNRGKIVTTMGVEVLKKSELSQTLKLSLVSLDEAENEKPTPEIILFDLKVTSQVKDDIVDYRHSELTYKLRPKFTYVNKSTFRQNGKNTRSVTINGKPVAVNRIQTLEQKVEGFEVDEL